MQFLRKSLPVFLAMFFLVGCSAVEKYFQQPTLAIQSGSVLFSEDFSTMENGWNTWNETDSLVAFQEGGLHFLINQPDLISWSRPGYKFGDVKIQADAIKIGGPDNNNFGVVCRMVDEQNFYAFLISSDGYAGILRVLEGQYQLLNENSLQFSADIHKGAALNQITAECNGDQLSLSINGQSVSSASDSNFSTGDIALLAGTYAETGVDIMFDNLVVYQP